MRQFAALLAPLVVASCVSSVPAATDQPPPVDTAILLDLRNWDAASSASRSLVAQEIARQLPELAFLGIERHSAGDQSHEVAVFHHRRAEMDFVLLPGGAFHTGSPEGELGRLDRETPRWTVIDQPFLIARTHVTSGQWVRAMGTGTAVDLRNADVPATSVTWTAATSFCVSYGLDLPMEAEWEWACRAGATTSWSFGDDPTQLARFAWFGDNSGGQCQPVAQLRPNAFGLYDMHGNAFQWCADAFPRSTTASADPGASPTSYRVVRGGAAVSPAHDTRCAYRGWNPPDVLDTFQGFRPIKRLSRDLLSPSGTGAPVSR